jgi:hypothetical protein
MAELLKNVSFEIKDLKNHMRVKMTDIIGIGL